MNIHLTAELEKLVQNKVSTGRYNSASEVVREALRLMEREDELRAIQIQELRDHVRKALAEAERGELTNGPDFMKLLGQDLESRAKKRKAG